MAKKINNKTDDKKTAHVPELTEEQRKILFPNPPMTLRQLKTKNKNGNKN